VFSWLLDVSCGQSEKNLMKVDDNLPDTGGILMIPSDFFRKDNSIRLLMAAAFLEPFWAALWSVTRIRHQQPPFYPGGHKIYAFLS